jgi:acyl carrier protein
MQEFNKIKSILIKKFNIKKLSIKLNSNLIDDFKLDSLDIIEFYILIENAFNIKIPNNTLNRFKSIHDIIIYLNNLLSGYSAVW